MDRVLILDVRDVTFRYPRAPRDALQGVTCTVSPGEFLAVIGPNGSGKTSLLRVALGVYAPEAGTARILDRPAAAWPRRELARVVGVVTQREDNLFPQRVVETVRLGRHAHRGVWGVERAADREAVDRALAQCDVANLSDRWLWSLSGGEYQRVRIARALAQEPRLLVLDEPTAGLDLRHEMELFELVRRLVDGQGLAAVMVTHDVNLAARFADRVLLLSNGRVAAHGSPRSVLTRQVVDAVYGWPVIISAFDGAPQVIPLRASHSSAPRGEP
ncbi:MAG TPA: ABC transporter ATP-binding protein [Gemmatimonadales bacterium]|nr:ABC transporter ATP-binding protein [Gemmatimonadales bacterium]